LEEGKRIETIFRENNQNVTLYKFEESTEKSLFKLNSPKILHIATHGFFLETDEKTAPKAGEQQNDPLLRSGLALTNANLGIKGEKQDDGSDGVLTSLEALGLQLNGTDLVVLSACETGVGEIRQGEGVNGLRGSFIQAGANSVLSTLWEISDSGTMEFMTRFYPPIIEGKNPQTSLQKTQREFINSDEWSHPFYWAPFVMVGRE
jgi:CHAT domain-containing protein